MSFGTGFAFFQIIFAVMFCLAIGGFVTVLVIVISRWHRNNQSPRLTVPATVVAKRTATSHHRNGTNGMYHTSHTY